MTSKAINHSPDTLIELYNHGLKIEDMTLSDLVTLFQKGLITVKELSLEHQIRICGKGLIEIEDICQLVKTATEESISIDELSKLYVSCLDLEKICFYDKSSTVELRELIAKKLYIDSIRAQEHWLEYMLHLLQHEHSDKIMDMLIKNMSIAYYPVFCTVYKTLVAKESTPDLPSGEITELRKLRKSMVKRVDKNAFDCGKKLSSCIVQETCLEVIEIILERIKALQDNEDFSFLPSSWSSIESMIEYPEAFGLEKQSTLIQTAMDVIAKRDELRRQQACIRTIEKILKILNDFQDSEDISFLPSSWSTIESMIEHPEAFGMKKESSLIKAAMEVIAKRDERNGTKKEHIK